MIFSSVRLPIRETAGLRPRLLTPTPQFILNYARNSFLRLQDQDRGSSAVGYCASFAEARGSMDPTENQPGLLRVNSSNSKNDHMAVYTCSRSSQSSLRISKVGSSYFLHGHCLWVQEQENTKSSKCSLCVFGAGTDLMKALAPPASQSESCPDLHIQRDAI